jgi:hypothetical protein
VCVCVHGTYDIVNTEQQGARNGRDTEPTNAHAHTVHVTCTHTHSHTSLRIDICAYRPAGDSALEGHEAHKLELAAADATVA